MDDLELLRDQLADAVRQVNDAERWMQRYEHAIDAITQLAWPECTDAQADASAYLTKLVTKVGVLALVTASERQAWDVLRKHVVANARLSRLVVQQREDARHAERERLELASRVVRLEAERRELSLKLRTLEMKRDVYELVQLINCGLAGKVGFDANGSPVEDAENRPLGMVT